MITPADESPWYAIWTRARAEKVVADQLQRKRIEAFLPTVPRWSRWKDRKKKIDWPLFPGYCFARFDPHYTLDVLKCVGVAQIISFDGKPAPIAHEEIEAIQILVSTELQFDPCPLLHEGDLVEVKLQQKIRCVSGQEDLCPFRRLLEQSGQHRQRSRMNALIRFVDTNERRRLWMEA